MIRRPLQNISTNRSVLSIVRDFQFRGAGLPPYGVHAPSSPFKYDHAHALARALGLDGAPQGKQSLSSPLKGQHPTAFLQFGWATDCKRHILVEMGDASALLSLVFRRVEPARKSCPWHMDELNIDDGQVMEGHPVPVSIECDKHSHVPLIERVFKTVGASVGYLRSGNARAAEQSFHTGLRPIIKQLDAESEALSTCHAASFVKIEAYKP